MYIDFFFRGLHTDIFSIVACINSRPIVPSDIILMLHWSDVKFRLLRCCLYLLLYINRIIVLRSVIACIGLVLYPRFYLKCILLSSPTESDCQAHARSNSRKKSTVSVIVEAHPVPKLCCLRLSAGPRQFNLASAILSSLLPKTTFRYFLPISAYPVLVVYVPRPVCFLLFRFALCPFFVC